ncbi:hypothetical protein [Nocardia thailandica]|uniref:Uncharacterized protein n=1 Tax=Nocardia thailandica TaxID=257275 RepID=A0ABW6PTC4_9NOCA
MTRKQMRVRLMADRALAKIEREGIPLNHAEFVQALNVTRMNVHGPLMHETVGRWSSLLLTGSVDDVRREMDDDELFTELSPLNVVLSKQERHDVLMDLHNRQVTRRFALAG